MKLIILDRDGVVNQDSPDYIKSPEEWHPYPRSLEAIRRLSRHGYAVVIATNQSAIARGLLTEKELMAIHHKMREAVLQKGGQIQHIFFCPHGPLEACACRKPKPGLFYHIAQTYGCSLKGVFAVGDSLRDLLAAKEAGAFPVLVLTGNGQKTNACEPLALEGVPVYPDLLDFVESLCLK